MAFRDLHSLLLTSHDNGLIDNNELMVLYDLYSSKNAGFPHDSYLPFVLEEPDELESVAEFLFRKQDIQALYNVLQIPETITCSQRCVCEGN